MTRGQALLLGLAVFGIGAAGYAGFKVGGLDGFSPGIAASALLMVLVLGWTSTYLFRVVTGRMTSSSSAVSTARAPTPSATTN